MIQETLKLLTGNSFFEILLIAVVLDTILGVLRAIKEHKFNSCVGIDGAIRKAAAQRWITDACRYYYAYQCSIYDSGQIYSVVGHSEDGSMRIFLPFICIV